MRKRWFKLCLNLRIISGRKKPGSSVQLSLKGKKEEQADGSVRYLLSGILIRLL